MSPRACLWARNDWVREVSDVQVDVGQFETRCTRRWQRSFGTGVTFGEDFTISSKCAVVFLVRRFGASTPHTHPAAIETDSV